MEERPPHPARVVQRREQHPAKASGGGPPHPHPATVVQRKAPHPATVVQRKAPHPAEARRSPGSRTIQRLLVYADVVDEVDQVIAADIAFQHDLAGGALMTLDDLLKVKVDEVAIKAGEPVIITGHGEPGAVQSKPAKDIAEQLLKIKNIEKAAFVYVTSCDAATSPESGGSVVEVVHEALGGKVTVVGAPGIAVNDFDKITGDWQTHYIKKTEEYAIALENLVTHVLEMHDVKASLKLGALDKALSSGKELLKTATFRKFYAALIGALSGKDQSWLAKLKDHCEDALQIEPSKGRKTWPQWLQGWVAAMEKSRSETYDDAAWISWCKKKTLKPALTAVEWLLDGKEQRSLISRVDLKQCPLQGIKAGEKKVVDMTYKDLLDLKG